MTASHPAARRLVPFFLFSCVVATAAWSPRTAQPAQATATALPSVTFKQILPKQIVYNYNANPCAEKYIPDGGAHGFVRADGKFVLQAQEDDNWQMVGNSPFNLQVSCPSILPTSRYGLLTRGETDIQATYTEDGQTIYGFAGQDLSRLNYAEGCVDQGGGNCWQNDIEEVVSTDGGNNFNFTSTGNGNVAAVSYALSPTGTTYTGYFNTSNIVKRNGYYYMLDFVNDTVTGGRTCLLRTNNLADPTSWRGYDGSGFTATTLPVAGSAAAACVGVRGGLLGVTSSLQYIPRKGIYIGVFQYVTQLPGDKALVPGVYYSTSADMVNWTPMQRLLVLPSISGMGSTDEATAYPVLMDPFSKTRNFETIDSNTPVVMFTDIYINQYGSETLDRNLSAIPVMMQ